MGETGPDQISGVKGSHPEEIFVAVIVFGHPQAEFRVGGAGAHEDFFIVHGDVLHGQDGFGPETADNKIDLVAGDQAFHGVGGIGHVQEFIGVGLDQFDFHLFLADLDAPFGIDLIGGHQWPRSNAPCPGRNSWGR